MAKRSALLIAACFLAMLTANAQTAAPAKPAVAAKPTKAAKPAYNPRDFSGVWMNDNTLDERLKREGRKRLDPNEPEPPPGPRDFALTPDYAKIMEQKRKAASQMAEGAEYCSWPGMPRIMTYPYPLEFLHTPGRVTMIFEAESQVRRIFLDRKTHIPDDDLTPSYNGDSIGHWEGDTLVVDTIGFNTQTKVGRGWPHSEKMRIVERIHYVDADTIHDEMTITDPLAFTKPITQTIVYSKRLDWTIKEYSCLENNRDSPNAQGQRAGGVVGAPSKE